MCKISLLIIGNSFQQNKDIIKRVKDESDSLAGETVQLVVKTIDPRSSVNIKPEEYDLAVVYESIIDNDCSREVLGSGLPILSWDVKPLSKSHQKTISSVVRGVIEKGLLCEYIVKVTNEIKITHQTYAPSVSSASSASAVGANISARS